MAIGTRAKTDDGSSFMTRFFNRFKLSSHSEMERFRTIVLVFLITGVMVFTLMGVQVYRGSRANIGDTAIYTTSFTTSRTQQPGEVLGVYGNERNSRSVLLFKWDKPEMMSKSAEDYEVYVSGMNARSSKPENTNTPMTGEVISFGQSGVMGVVLDTPDKFNLQILNLTVIAKKEIAPLNIMKEDDLIAHGYDSTFETDDGFRIIFNPAGRLYTYIPALDKDEFDVRGFFNDTYMVSQERALRKRLDTSLQTMKSAQDRILNFYEQAETLSTTVGDDTNVKLVVSNPPDAIAGDDVTGESSQTLKYEFDTGIEGPAIKSLASKSERAVEVDTYPDGYMPNTYKLNTTHVIAGGFNFDWRDKTIGEGYLKDLVPSGANGRSYVEKISSEPNENVSFNGRGMLSNGKYLSDVQTSSSVSVGAQQLQTLSNNITQAYSDFFSAKRQYQRVDLQQLLLLELELDDVVSQTTMSQGRDNVTFRQ